MTHGQAMRYIILPQAIKVILPPVGNEFISLLKDSSLVSVVSVADMTRRGREFMAANFLPVETWLMVALLYLIMTLISARLVAWIERKTKTEER
jgi:polar amino acid transport system permease protein